MLCLSWWLVLLLAMLLIVLLDIMWEGKWFFTRWDVLLDEIPDANCGCDCLSDELRCRDDDKEDEDCLREGCCCWSSFVLYPLTLLLLWPRVDCRLLELLCLRRSPPTTIFCLLNATRKGSSVTPERTEAEAAGPSYSFLLVRRIRKFIALGLAVWSWAVQRVDTTLLSYKPHPYGWNLCIHSRLP